MTSTIAVANLIIVLQWIVWGFLGALGAIVIFRLLTGQINIKGLLTDAANPTISVTKLQMLGASFIVALSYLGKVASTQTGNSLPEVDQEMLLLLGGSQAAYLGGKGAALLGWFGQGNTLR